jgi:hypothetical protein
MENMMPRKRKVESTSSNEIAVSEETESSITAPPDPVSYSINIDWAIPQDTSSKFATHLVVQHDEGQFFLHFFEVRPPLIMGTPEEQFEHWKRLGAVRAGYVVTLAVSAKNVPLMLQLLQENLAVHEGAYRVDKRLKEESTE